ncbi:arginine--tRNA ligase [Vacuolonema iberomarrocanum]|uniref:arginine--tRNA ligase n=1 Tax=Vacuolonema iberomarrocanum TaxID=3454632 RepID=UPI0019FA1E98|nr:arginine--tRNA ligase [filamentous cyanobacterium LEGE 07170]
MLSTIAQLRAAVQQALIRAFGEAFATTDPMLVSASNPKFGDYQANVALSLAKPLGQAPRAIAEQLVQNLDVAELCDPPSVAGPGFINFSLKHSFLEEQLQAIRIDPRLGVEPLGAGKRAIVDYPSPNIAKEMHVGHLRPSVIGDCLARILEFLGYETLRISHLGDWGTPFGMLIAYLREAYPNALNDDSAINLGDLASFYRAAKRRFDEDTNFQDTARQSVVQLQAGDPETLKAWGIVCDLSNQTNQKIFDLMGLKPLILRGESFYNPFLSDVVAELDRLGLLVEDQGAQCVFLEGFTNKEGKPLPMIVQKSDGGYNYATTDLAAIRYRVTEDQVQRVVYPVGAEQSNHFAQIFQVGKRAGWIKEDHDFVHAPLGNVLGEDGKKLKSRSGEAARLKDLLDEAWLRADPDLYQLVCEQDWEAIALVLLEEPDWETAAARLSSDESLADNVAALKKTTIETVQRQVPIWLMGNEPVPSVAQPVVANIRQALEQRWVENRGLGAERSFQSILSDVQAIGISAIKYADLSQNRTSNYVFSYAKMLALQGNTAPYMLYAYVRIQGIGRKGGIDFSELDAKSPILLKEDVELTLAKQLLQLDEMLLMIDQDLLPNRLGQYLFELSQKFNQFYDRCPILQAEEEDVKTSRLILCHLTAKTIKLGLSLLGISVLERM